MIAYPFAQLVGVDIILKSHFGNRNTGPQARKNQLLFNTLLKNPTLDSWKER